MTNLGLQCTQAAAICYRHNAGQLEFLLVKNKNGNRRIFPKGNMKENEDPWLTAEREASEEAGAKGRIDKTVLTRYCHHQSKSQKQDLVVTAFLLEVASQGNHESGREPKWYSPREAEEALERGRTTIDAVEFKRLMQAASARLQAWYYGKNKSPQRMARIATVTPITGHETTTMTSSPKIVATNATGPIGQSSARPTRLAGPASVRTSPTNTPSPYTEVMIIDSSGKPLS
jgi:8-oxo-dGTP pyrophosphatase MutT (NUDIX family)